MKNSKNCFLPFVITLLIFTCKGVEEKKLIDAIERSKPLLVEQLLEGSDSEKHLKELLDDGSGALHLACRISDSQEGYAIFKLLLRSGSCPQQGNHQLETPIHDSCYLKHSERRNEVIEDLLFHGGRLLQEDINGKTVIERLIDLQSQKDLEDFLNYFGYMVSKRDFARSIEFAGKKAGEGRGYTDLTGVLKRFMSEDRKPKTIFEALLLGDFKIVTEMISKNPSLIEAKEKRWGFTPIIISLLKEDRKVIEFLMEKGASLKIEDLFGRSPLHVVCEGCVALGEKRELVRMLIKKGANKDQVDIKKRSAVSIGLKKGLEKELFEMGQIKR
jgi:ankyrin repeat protein